MDERQEKFVREVGKLTRRSYWIGAALGLLVGFGAGFLVSQLTVERVVVIPFQQGTAI